MCGTCTRQARDGGSSMLQGETPDVAVRRSRYCRSGQMHGPRAEVPHSLRQTCCISPQCNRARRPAAPHPRVTRGMLSKLPGSLNCLTCLIIRLIIQTIRLDPSGSVWTDDPSNVSRPDRSGADQIDAEHQARDLKEFAPSSDMVVAHHRDRPQ
jgi:hypothetical protein